MRLQKLFITTLLSVSVIGMAIPANVSAASYATTKRTYTLKVAGKKAEKRKLAVQSIMVRRSKQKHLASYVVIQPCIPQAMYSRRD